MNELHLFYSHIKVAIPMLIASIAYLAEAAIDDLGKIESITLKGVLIIAILWLVRELSKERQKSQEEALEREKKLEAALIENARARDEHTAAIKEQTNYFRDVAKVIIDRELNGHNNHNGQ